MFNLKRDSRKIWLRWCGLLTLCIMIWFVGACSSATESTKSSGFNESLPMHSAQSEAGRAALSYVASDQAARNVASAPTPPTAPVSADHSGSGFGSSISADTNTSAAGLNLKMIYTANMTMEVADYSEAQAVIRNMVMLSDGYILQFSDHQTVHERGGTFVIKVPAQGFMTFIDNLGNIKTVKPAQLSMKGQDVTEEYVDLTSRLKAKQVTEERLLSFMERATGTDDLVRFTQELGRVQEEIEQIKGRMRYLDQNVAYSTVEIRMFEQIGSKMMNLVEEEAPVWERAIEAMKNSFLATSRFFGELFVIFFAALPIILVFGVIAVVVLIIYRQVSKNAKHNKLKDQFLEGHDDDEQKS